MTGPGEDPLPRFEPRPLGRRDLEVQVHAGLRMLGAADRAAAVERAHAARARGRWNHPRRRRRLASFTLGALLFLPLLDLLLLPAGARALPAQLAAAALVGGVLGIRRWQRLGSGAWVAAYIPLLLALQGAAGRVLSLGGMMWVLTYFLVGFAAGTSEELACDEDP